MLPWSIPVIVAGIVWTKIFSCNGIINTIFIQTGIVSEAINFFGVPLYSKFSVIVAEIWKATPYLSLLILAGLLTIPKEYYEASQIDGAGKIKFFDEIITISQAILLPKTSVASCNEFAFSIDEVIIKSNDSKLLHISSDLLKSKEVSQLT